MREGLIPHKITTILRLSTTQDRARTLTEALAEVFDPEYSAVAAFEQKDGSWLVEIYFAEEPDEKAVCDLVALVAGKAAASSMRFEALAAKDWVAASLEGLKPIRAGRFLVHGAHDRAFVLANDIGIEIEASLAFGTGHHGTTRGCLLALDSIIKQSRPARVLDVGTGTGVLAIAAAKALRSEIIAGDIDPVAIEVARENARQNGVASRLRLYCAPGLRHPLAARPSRFDLILANILARPLAQLSPDLAGGLSAKRQARRLGLAGSGCRNRAFGLRATRPSPRAAIPHRRLGHLDPRLAPSSFPRAAKSTREMMPIFGVEIPFASHCGIEALEAPDGRTLLRLVLAPQHLNNIGMAHGGVTCTLLDIAMGSSARRHADLPVMTLDMQTSFIAPGRGVLVGEGRVVRAGRSVIFCEGEVRTESGELVAKGSGLFKPVRPRADEG